MRLSVLGVCWAHFMFSHQSVFWLVSQGSGYRRCGKKGKIEVKGAEQTDWRWVF